jgi:hypothetical protein
MCNLKRICNICTIKKPLTSEFFHKKLDSFHSICKECRRTQEKTRYLKQKSKKNIQSKDYYQSHKDQLKLYAKNYRQENEEKLANYEKLRYKKKSEKRKILAAKDGSSKILHNMRVCINRCVRNKQKSSPTLKYLGCSLEEFKIHLESKFDSKMTWSNYGRPTGTNRDGWHIDHIKSLASFKFSSSDTSEQFEEKLKLAWHHTNLQPLWGLDNISKGKK